MDNGGGGGGAPRAGALVNLGSSVSRRWNEAERFQRSPRPSGAVQQDPARPLKEPFTASAFHSGQKNESC